jgi:hypothetical protein
MTLQDLMTFAGISFPLSRPKAFFITVPEYIYAQLGRQFNDDESGAILVTQKPADDGPEVTVFQGTDGRRYKISPGNCLIIEPAQP